MFIPGVQTRFRLCELFGIPLYLDFSLAILLLLFATGGSGLLSGLLGAVLLLFSITAHELGHALTARAFGYGTHDITLSLLGGCASLISLPRKPSQEFLTAVAGPAVSFALGAAAVAGMSALAEQGSAAAAFFHAVTGSLGYGAMGAHVVYFHGEEPVLAIARGSFAAFDLLFDFACMNLMLGAFNLLPGFPLDGGRVFRSAMGAFMNRARATFIAMVVGRGVAVLLALAGLRRLFNGGNWGFVTILIAWMIWKEGYREYRQALDEGVWDGKWDFSARVSPPPYGGKSDETEVRRGH